MWKGFCPPRDSFQYRSISSLQFGDSEASSEVSAQDSLGVLAAEEGLGFALQPGDAPRGRRSVPLAHQTAGTVRKVALVAATLVALTNHLWMSELAILCSVIISSHLVIGTLGTSVSTFLVSPSLSWKSTTRQGRSQEGLLYASPA